MTWFDLAFLAVLAGFLFAGYRRGLVGQLLGLAGMILSLVIAFTFFGQVGDFFSQLIPVSREIAGVLGFILIVVVINGLCTLAAARWRKATKSTALSAVDSWAGAVLGGLKAILIIFMLVVILVSLPYPALRARLQESPLISGVLRAAPLLYILQERSLPADVPRLLITPQGVQLKKINFASLDNSVCLVCKHRVKYDGFVRKGLLSYPHFTCAYCGTVSDGCLTYQGYHLIYGVCPVAVANQGKDLNCHVWPGANPIKPLRPCPICGQQ